MTETLAQEAYRLLKDIPEWRWTTRNWLDRNWFGFNRCCFVGHYNRIKNGGSYNIVACQVLNAPEKTLANHLNSKLVDINDRWIDRYQQSTPKQRVLAFLQDKINEGL